MEIIGRKKAIGTATLFPTSLLYHAKTPQRTEPSASGFPAKCLPSIFTASISQPNQFLPSPKEKASFSMKIMCYNLSLNRNTLNINENWCEITIPTKYKPYLKASKHPEIDWSNARVPPFHRPALRRCSKDFTVFPGSVEAGGAWILLVGRNSMRWFSPGWGLGVGDWWWLMIIGWEDHVISKSVSLSFKGTVINGRSYWMGTY